MITKFHPISARYRKIVTAIHQTIHIMGEIDETIEANGGWLDALVTGNEGADL